MDTATVTIRLRKEQLERLGALAEATNRTRSFLAAEAIAAFLAREEWQIAAIKEGLAELDAPEPPPVEHERVAAWLRSWGDETELPPPD